MIDGAAEAFARNEVSSFQTNVRQPAVQNRPPAPDDEMLQVSRPESFRDAFPQAESMMPVHEPARSPNTRRTQVRLALDLHSQLSVAMASPLLPMPAQLETPSTQTLTHPVPGCRAVTASARRLSDEAG